MKKTYIAPALHMESMDVELPVADSLKLNPTTVGGSAALGKEHDEQAVEDQQNGWNDGLW